MERDGAAELCRCRAMAGMTVKRGARTTQKARPPGARGRWPRRIVLVQVQSGGLLPGVETWEAGSHRGERWVERRARNRGVTVGSEEMREAPWRGLAPLPGTGRRESQVLATAGCVILKLLVNMVGFGGSPGGALRVDTSLAGS